GRFRGGWDSRRLDLRKRQRSGHRSVVGRAAHGARRTASCTRGHHPPVQGVCRQVSQSTMSERVSFRTIRDEMARRIAERRWLPGALIPGEEALAREFGAARATVNRALQELARAGLIERRRRAGTRVARHPVREARFVIPLVRQEIERQGKSYQYQLLSRHETTAPDIVRARLGLD